MVSSAYLRLLIFLHETLIPAIESVNRFHSCFSKCPLSYYFFADPRVGQPMHGPLLTAGHSAGDRILVVMSPSLLLISVWSFIIGCTEALQSALRSPSGGTAVFVGVDSVSLWEEMSSGSSYAKIKTPK